MTGDIPYYKTNEDENVLRLFVIRHGQTDANVKKILQGHMDTELNLTGREQASKLGKYLSQERKITWDRVYSSDLKRCQQTIETILGEFDEPVEVETSNQLRERCMGVIEGMYLRDAEKYATDRGHPSFRDYGEPPEEFCQRLDAALKRILSESKSHKNVAVISHGGTIRQLLKLLHYQEIDIGKVIVFNTSVTIIDYDKTHKTFAVRRMGNTQHLGSGEFIVSDLQLRRHHSQPLRRVLIGLGTGSKQQEMGFWDNVVAAWKGEDAKNAPGATNADKSHQSGKQYTFQQMVNLVKDKPESTVLLDVREPSEFSIVKIPGSVNMPYKTAPDALAYGEDEFQSKFGFPKPGKDQELVFFCAAGRRAEGAHNKAISEGYTKASIYPGSMNDWVANGGDKLKF